MCGSKCMMQLKLCMNYVQRLFPMMKMKRFLDTEKHKFDTIKMKIERATINDSPFLTNP